MDTVVTIVAIAALLAYPVMTIYGTKWVHRKERATATVAGAPAASPHSER